MEQLNKNMHTSTYQPSYGYQNPYQHSSAYSYTFSKIPLNSVTIALIMLLVFISALVITSKRMNHFKK